MFDRNMGKADRIIGFILALVILVFSFVLELYPLIIVSVLLLFTVLTSFCGIYKLFGLTTCKTDLEEKK
jgi:cobalamin biosynthesis protein CobD/CbiB